MKKIIALFMMGLITILSPLTLKANTYSIDQPVIDLNNHTLNEVFTATEKDLTDYEITSILDTPVYEGLSLRDIFEDGNLVVNGDFNGGTTNFSALYGDLSYDNGKAKVVGNGLTTSTGIDYNPNISFAYNEQIYIAGYIELDLTDLLLIAINIQLRDSGGNFLGNVTKNIDKTSNNTYISTIHTSNNVNASYTDFIRFILTYTSKETQNGKINYFDNIFAVPMSLFTIAPTQNQLDEWLDMYLTHKDALFNIDVMLPYYNDTYNYTMDETEFAYWEQLYHDYIFTIDRYEWYNDTGFITAANYDFYRAEYDLWKGVNADFHLFSDFDDITSDYTISVTLPNDIDDNLDNGIEAFGLGNFGRFLILFVIIGAISLLLGLIHVPYSMILLVDILLFMTSFLLDWIPAWLGIITVIVLFITLITVVIRRN